MAGTFGALSALGNTTLRSTALGRTAALGRIVLGIAVLEPVASDAGGGFAAAGTVSGWGVVGGVFWLSQATWVGQAGQGDGDLDVDVDACWEGEVSGA